MKIKKKIIKRVVVVGLVVLAGYLFMPRPTIDEGGVAWFRPPTPFDRHDANVITVGDASDYSTIAEALAVASSGDVIWVQPGTYAVTSTINISNKSNLTIQGFGKQSKLDFTAGMAYGIRVLNSSSNITIKDLWLDGNDTVTYLVKIENSTFVNVENCIITNPRADGVTFGPDVSDCNIRFSEIANCNISEGFEGGTEFSSAVEFEDGAVRCSAVSNIISNSRTGIYLHVHDGDTTCHDITMTDNTLVGKDVLLEDCEDVWTSAAAGYCTMTADASVYKVGAKSAKFTVDAGASVGLLAYENLDNTTDPYNAEWAWIVNHWIRATGTNIAEGDLWLVFSESANCGTLDDTMSIAGITSANKWEWRKHNSDLTNSATLARSNTRNALKSVGIYLATDEGAFAFYIDDMRLRSNAQIISEGDAGDPAMRNILIDGNTLTGSSISADSPQQVVISNNVLRNSYAKENSAIYTASTAGCEASVIANRIHASEIHGIEVESDGAIVSANIITESQADGISAKADDCVISNNITTDNAQNTDRAGYGINVSGDNCVVSGNISSNSGGATTPQDYGIRYADGSDYIVMTGNLCFDVTSFGYWQGSGNANGLVFGNVGTSREDDARVDPKLYYREYMQNLSGGQLVDGDVVVISSDADNTTGKGFTTTTAAGDARVVGMLTETVADDAWGWVQVLGDITTLKVDGTDDIAVGDVLSAFSAAGIAQKAAQGEVIFAIAREGYTTDDSAGVLDATLITPRQME